MVDLVMRTNCCNGHINYQLKLLSNWWFRWLEFEFPCHGRALGHQIPIICRLGDMRRLRRRLGHVGILLNPVRIKKPFTFELGRAPSIFFTQTLLVSGVRGYTC